MYKTTQFFVMPESYSKIAQICFLLVPPGQSGVGVVRLVDALPSLNESSQKGNVQQRSKFDDRNVVEH